MRYVCSVLYALLVTTALMSALARAELALDITLAPSKEPVAKDQVKPPFQTGLPIAFQVKNNTPVQQILKITASVKAVIDKGCDKVAADSSCIVRVTPEELGTLRVTATSSTGRNVGISEPYPIAMRLDVTLAPKKDVRAGDQVTPPFKLGLPIPFQVKNNTPSQKFLDITASVEADIGHGCDEVAADSACIVRVTPKEYDGGTIQVTATSSTGRSVGKSEPYFIAPLDVTLAPRKGLLTEEQTTPPFKPGKPIAFQVKNYAPRQQRLKISASIDAEIGDDCNKVEANSSCMVRITPKEFGTLQVTATSFTGQNVGSSEPYPVAFRFATYNISFDRNCNANCTDDGEKRCREGCDTGFTVLEEQVALTREQQQDLIDRFYSGQIMIPKNRALAEAAIQIRNVAEVIQRTNPDVVLLNEFDNDGIANDDTAIQNFMDNYLKESQNGQMPVEYKDFKNISTNTGKPSGYDLDNDGSTEGPSDAWGYGYYHGQYAFTVFSKYLFGDMRTFQNRLWQSLPADNPKIDDCEDPEKPIPKGMECGDPWFKPLAWLNHPLSSKNHIDLAVKLDSADNSKIIHLLASHPTPPVFDGPARRNYKRNRDEIDFWSKYISGANFMDDDNSTNAIGPNAYFVIAGDLNADPEVGDGDREMIKGLLMDKKVNTAATTGKFRPTSRGAQEFLDSDDCKRDCKRPDGDTITSVSSLRLDHVIPSANLAIVGSGVFWPASYESGRHLVYDKMLGVSKGVSSDHRLVWVDLYIPPKQPNTKTEL